MESRDLINITEVPEGEERKETEKAFEDILAGKFPTLIKNINPQIQSAQRTLHRINIKKDTKALHSLTAEQQT